MPTAHPLLGVLQLWAVAIVTSLLTSAGLARALRGAFIGSGDWIVRVDAIADFSSQLAAISTALLLVYMGMLSSRVSQTLGFGMLALLFGFPATLLLFFAHQHALPHLHLWFAAVFSSLSLLACASQVKTRPLVQATVALAGFMLLAQALRTGELFPSNTLGQLGAFLRIACAWGALLLGLGWHFWATRSTPWRGAILLGASTLLAATAGAATQSHASEAVIVIGRSLAELGPESELGASGPLLLSLSLSLTFSRLLQPGGSLGLLICALLILGCIAPTTPLTLGLLTLCGYSAVVLSWQPARATSQYLS